MTTRTQGEEIITTHDLKIWTEYFDDITAGRKGFELRRNNRDYHVGDTLRLHEYDPHTDTYTGRETTAKVTAMYENIDGLNKTHCIFSIQPTPCKQEHEKSAMNNNFYTHHKPTIEQYFGDTTEFCQKIIDVNNELDLFVRFFNRIDETNTAHNLNKAYYALCNFIEKNMED